MKQATRGRSVQERIRKRKQRQQIERDRAKRRQKREKKNELRRSQIPADKTWLTSADVGAILDCDERTIRKYVKDGSLIAAPMGKNGARLRFRREWVREWQDGKRAEANADKARKLAKEDLPLSSYDPELMLVLWVKWKRIARSNENFASWCDGIEKNTRCYLAQKNLNGLVESLQASYPLLGLVYPPKSTPAEQSERIKKQKEERIERNGGKGKAEESEIIVLREPQGI
jgi:hypothetical protein